MYAGARQKGLGLLQTGVGLIQGRSKVDSYKNHKARSMNRASFLRVSILVRALQRGVYTGALTFGDSHINAL